jgi:hypothetical protein
MNYVRNGAGDIDRAGEVPSLLPLAYCESSSRRFPIFAASFVRLSGDLLWG